MALVIGGAEYSGKINNKVFLRTGSVRGYAVPANPATPAQIAMRSLVGSITTQFRTFGDMDQKGWIDAALNYPRTNRVGATYVLSGLNLWISCSVIARLGNDFGQPMVIPAAGFPPVPNIASGCMLESVDASEPSMVLTFNAAPTSGEFIFVYATRSLSAAVNFTRKSDYRLIAVVRGSDFTGSTINLITQYESVFPSGILGARIFFDAYAVNDGENVKRPAGKAFGIVA